MTEGLPEQAQLAIPPICLSLSLSLPLCLESAQNGPRSFVAKILPNTWQDRDEVRNQSPLAVGIDLCLHPAVQVPWLSGWTCPGRDRWPLSCRSHPQGRLQPTQLCQDWAIGPAPSDRVSTPRYCPMDHSSTGQTTSPPSRQDRTDSSHLCGTATCCAACKAMRV